MPCMEGYFRLVHWQDSLDKSMGGQFSLVYDSQLNPFNGRSVYFTVLKGQFNLPGMHCQSFRFVHRQISID